jgi:hypothetical protein
MFSGPVFSAEFISELAAVLAWLWDDRICSKHVAYFVVFLYFTYGSSCTSGPQLLDGHGGYQEPNKEPISSRENNIVIIIL